MGLIRHNFNGKFGRKTIEREREREREYKCVFGSKSPFRYNLFY